ncbi:MAG: ABC transporter ATP-binding protein [Anaerolineales bacterium]|nr:ABC transporter ATP-binding protein [Anaerolineales bacterium]
MSRLKADGLRKHFGGIAALVNVTLEVEPGERRAIIGPNGAGKSTLLNVLAGDLPPTAGRVCLDGREITRLPAHDRANLGLGRTFQRNNLFAGLSVFANTRLAVQHRQGLGREMLRDVRRFHAVTRETEAILEQVGLAEQRDRAVSTLAYGQQRALEVALALASKPKVLLLDEPTAGMSPAETAEMVKFIGALPRWLTMLIVEHDMDVVFTLADRITVLHFGEVLAEGAPEEVRANTRVQEVYLGASRA